MRTISSRRAMLVSLSGLATVCMAACTAHPAGNAAANPSNGQTTTPAASAAASPPAAGSSAAPTLQGGVQNLVISDAVRSQLTAAFVAHYGISQSDVAGTYPGTVYYAYDPATDTYWAAAQFMPSSTAPMNVLVEFQDGGNFGMFQKSGSGPWQLSIAGDPPSCSYPKFFPQAVLMAWSLPTSIPTGLHC
jgi:hypothetical protein